MDSSLTLHCYPIRSATRGRGRRRDLGETTQHLDDVVTLVEDFDGVPQVPDELVALEDHFPAADDACSFHATQDRRPRRMVQDVRSRPTSVA